VKNSGGEMGRGVKQARKVKKVAGGQTDPEEEEKQEILNYWF
jgi:hypothetical protein